MRAFVEQKRISRRMRTTRRTGAFTLIEVLVAIVVLAAGALALAASSAFVARAMARNAVRETAARVATNRIETVKSECVLATSGRETIQQVVSEWSVEGSPPIITLVGSVRCLSAPAGCGA